MSLNTASITAAIKALSIPGVTILDLVDLPDQVQGRTNEVPVLMPEPNAFIQGGAAEGDLDGLETFGTPTERFWLFRRTFRYQYLHAKAGSGRSLADHYPAMCAKVDAIMEALTALDVATKDVMTINVSAFGVFGDNSGAQFFGCQLDIMIREKVNP